MSAARGFSTLEAACQHAQPGGWQLWLRYFPLGGSASRAELERHIRDGDVLDDHQRDVLVHALNEQFADMDLGYPLPYASEPRG